MIPRLRYWHHRFCTAWMDALLGEDKIKAIVAHDRRAELLRSAFADDGRTP